MSAQKAAELPRMGASLNAMLNVSTRSRLTPRSTKPHRIETYIRWAASTPPGFRFAVKVPRTISHDRLWLGRLRPAARGICDAGPRAWGKSLASYWFSFLRLWSSNNRSPSRSSRSFACAFPHRSQLSRDTRAGSRPRSITGYVSGVFHEWPPIRRLRRREMSPGVAWTYATIAGTVRRRCIFPNTNMWR